MARDRAVHYSKVTGRELRQRGHDLGNRVHGAVVEARSLFEETAEVSDEKLVARVRTELGHHVSHPHALKTFADEGWVTVLGPIFADEADVLLQHLAQVKGVKAIEDRLERHERGENVPALQNGKQEWGNSSRFSSAARVLALFAGGAIVLYGSRKSGLMKNAITTLGAGVFGFGADGQTDPAVPNGSNMSKETFEKEERGDTTMKVRDIMTKDPVCCVPRASLEEVAHMMTELDCGAIPVVENLLTRKPIGIITDRDIVINSLARGKNPMHMIAEEIMSFPAITVSADTPVEECCEKMEADQIRRMIVVDARGCCCGIVAQADIAQRGPRYEIAELVKDVSAHRAAA